ncbi:MAG: filamentous hemagglutinin N-terminal domain-containing protein [Rhizobiales bacterium]|nr:filamentous hemagglutinin N-terminal domain-containing protein [Hyphomicrobiales bacterium]
MASTALMLAGASTGWAQQLPVGGAVSAGAATIQQAGPGALVINQSSGRAILSWQNFSIGQGGTVTFNNGAGATLNRVTGNVPSRIDGTLTASGSVYLVNPAGVAVGTTGRVATGGSFVASTHNVTDRDFLAGGDLTFSGTSTATIVNAGRIGSLGGDVALIARKVENTGTLTAPGGTVGLIAGYEVLVRDGERDGGKFSVKVGGADTEVKTSGKISAATAELRANGGNVYALAGNTKGVIAATGTATKGGRIFLTAGSGTVEAGGHITASRTTSSGAKAGGDVRVSGKTASVTGKVDAKGSGGAKGGTVVVEGDAVTLAATARIDASGATGGTVLIGGDYQGGGNAATKRLPETVRTASTTHVAAGARILADGTDGSGGNIVVWADGATSFAGAISARGTGTGDGGSAEVSGKRTLAFTGTVDLRAANGRTGMLLLDPENLTISNDATSGVTTSAGPTYTASANDSVLNVSTLLAALATSNVTVTTGGVGSPGDQAGNLTVAAGLSWSAETTLTLIAANDLTVAANVGYSGDLGSLTLNAGHDIVIGANIEVNGQLSRLTLDAGHDIRVTGAVTAHGGAAVLDFTAANAIHINNAVLLDGANPTLTLTARDINVNAPVTATGDYATIAVNHSGDLRYALGTGGTISLPGGNATYIENGSTYTLIHSMADLAAVSGNASTHYAIANDLNAGDEGTYSDSVVTGDFTQVLTGLGHTILGLSIDAPDSDDPVGLFSTVSGTLGNLVLVGGDVRGKHDTGAVAGMLTGTMSGLRSSVAVDGRSRVGGLVGSVGGAGILRDAAASGTVRGTSELGGLVGLNGGTVSGSHADGAVTGTQNVGGLIGSNTGLVEASFATGAATGSTTVGGLVGGSNGVIDASYATGAATASDTVGGLVGLNGNTISASYATGTVTGQYMVGGLVGQNASIIEESHADGTVLGLSGAYGAVGGLVGHNDGGIIRGSHATASVTTQSGMVDVGGLVGTNAGAITASYATGQVDAADDNDKVGGLAGYNAGTVASSYATGDVFGGTRVGGLIGKNEGADTLSGTHAEGNVSGIDMVGGLIGDSRVPVSQVYATGAVTSSASVEGVGGLIGLAEESVSEAYATGAVRGQQNVGGLIGRLGGSPASFVYALGSVIGTTNVGGLVGLLGGASASLSNGYASGRVMGGTQAGGLVGLVNFASVTASYWDKETTGQLTSSGSSASAGLTTAQARDPASYTGWDFTTAWFGAAGLRPLGRWEAVTSGGVTLISNAHQLQLAAADLSGTYQMVADVDAGATGIGTDGTPGIWGTAGFLPIGSDIDPFTGTFDGLGHVISNLTIFRPSRDGVGLFGVSLQSIRNVSLDGGAITGRDATGALAGYAHGTVANSHSTASVTGAVYVGGLVGVNASATISGSSSGGAVSGTNYVGGLVGENSAAIDTSYATGTVSGQTNVGGLAGNNDGLISRSYASGAVVGVSAVGGLVGTNNFSTISQAYALGSVTGTSQVGGLVGLNSLGTIDMAYATGLVLPAQTDPASLFVGGLVGRDIIGTVTASYWDMDSTGQTGSGVTSGATGLTSAQARDASSYVGWDFSATWFQTGDLRPIGRWEEAAPVLGVTTISNLHQLQLAAANPAGNYLLAADIDASLTGSQSETSSGIWSATGFQGIGGGGIGGGGTGFTGTFLGAGHVISNLVIDRTAATGDRDHAGLFAQADAGAVIRGVTLEGGAVSGERLVGGLVGFVSDPSVVISDVHVVSMDVSGINYVGGLIGRNGIAGNGYDTFDVSGASITNASVSGGTVNGESAIGGLIGESTGGRHSDVSASATVGSSASSQVGGLIGLSSGETIVRASATGDVTGQAAVGGLIGSLKADNRGHRGTLSDSYATGAVTGHDNNVGGLIGGLGDSDISNVHASGNVTLLLLWSGGEHFVGGLVGDGYYGSVTNAYATGSVTMFEMGGGMCGDGTCAAGGLLGRQVNTNVINSYATGEVGTGVTVTSGGRGYVGGLVGLAEGEIRDSYATGSVTSLGDCTDGACAAGGLVGRLAGGSVANAYATGDVSMATGQNFAGGLVGSSNGYINSVYATGSVTGSADCAANTCVGGLVGYNEAGQTVENGYWDTDTTGLANAIGTDDGAQNNLTGITTAQTFDASTYGNFNLNDTWVLFDGFTRPFLRSEYSTSVANAHQLQLMALRPEADYVLVADIDLSVTLVASQMWSTSTGFVPIGTQATPFTGSLDGQQHVISNLYINRPTADYVGLFGAIGAAGSVTDVGLQDATVTGNDHVGALAGSNAGTITNVYSCCGAVIGTSYVGGIAGDNSGRIVNAFTTGVVSGTGSYVGGLVGDNGGTLDSAASDADVFGTDHVGGLVGRNSGTVSNTYATGSVQGTDKVGGLVGANFGTIANSYAVGLVDGTSQAGALVGLNFGTITSSFWDSDVAALSGVSGIGMGTPGGMGLTTSQFEDTWAFMALSGWNFLSRWAPSGDGYLPVLYALMPVTWAPLIASDAVYGDSTATVTAYGPTFGGPGRFVFGPAGDTLPLPTGWTVPVAGTPDAGTHVVEQPAANALAISAEGMPYRILYAGANVITIAARHITVTADAQTRDYGDANPDLTYAVTSGSLVPGDSLVGSLLTGATATSDVGTYAITQGTLTDANNPNYAIIYVGADLSVTPATLTYVATAASRDYGDANPTLTGTVTGFKNGQTVSVLTGSASWTTTADANSDVGDYAIDGSGYSATNYVFTQAADNATALTVTPATLTYVATTATREYGDANPTLTGTVTGFKNGQTVSVLTGSASWTSPADANSDVGDYAITGSGYGATNYVFTQAAGNATALSVTPATLTYVATAASRDYGDANPTLTGAVTGFKNGQTVSVLTGSASWTSPADASSNVGAYAIDGSGYSSTNYVFTQAAGNATALSVTPATLTYVATAATRDYGDANPTLTGTVTGFKNGQTVSVLTGSASWTTTADANSDVGDYAIDGAGYSATNYVFTQAAGNATALSVTPATLTVAAIPSATELVYGTGLPGFGYAASGWKNGQTDANLTGVGFSTNAGSAPDVGAYVVSAQDGTLIGAAAGNYSLVYARPAEFSVTPATLLVGATTASSILYGAGLPAFGVSASGWAYGQSTQANLSGVTLSTNAGSQPDVGLYGVLAAGGTLTGAASGNYTLSYAPSAPFQVTPRPITVAADAQTRPYGDANPALTYIVGGDGLAYGQSLTLATAAGAASPVGRYAITLADSAVNANYAITYTGATLAVTQRPLTVAAENETMAFGGTEPPLAWQITAGSLVNGDQMSGALVRQPGAAPGIYAILQGTLAATANYDLTYIPGLFTITGTGGGFPTPQEIALITALTPPSDFVQTSAMAPFVWTPLPTSGDDGFDDPSAADANCVGTDCQMVPFRTNRTYGAALSYRTRP